MNKLPFDYDLISNDYIPNYEEDDDRLYNTKACIQALSRAERRILLTYVELGTYAAAAREFNVSPPTIKSYLNGIISKVYSCSQSGATY